MLISCLKFDSEHNIDFAISCRFKGILVYLRHPSGL
ncbi:hypothetical protein CPS_5008 [Colwellia psychrerythraea 34H]|uniref:Uncharacterized protein n=1 Tax=Colwellia psychrerythraea (strain 34H / ATCC BAA-681) TaxID=167879 RepID=Q47U76_COLP3|nr:hypothetical protein CPS_5008 [Colwellia psychrerythraea 34H]